MINGWINYTQTAWNFHKIHEFFCFRKSDKTLLIYKSLAWTWTLKVSAAIIWKLFQLYIWLLSWVALKVGDWTKSARLLSPFPSPTHSFSLLLTYMMIFWVYCSHIWWLIDSKSGTLKKGNRNHTTCDLASHPHFGCFFLCCATYSNDGRSTERSKQIERERTQTITLHQKVSTPHCSQSMKDSLYLTLVLGKWSLSYT